MVKAIDTNYNGYNFRSRLEARWAVYFDQFNTEWLYENEGYDLDGVYYLPDFFFPKYNTYLEVKGVAFTEEEKSKCFSLAKHTNCKVIGVVGLPHLNLVDVYVPYIGTTCGKCNHSEYYDWDGKLVKCECEAEEIKVTKVEVTDAILLLQCYKEKYIPLYYADRLYDDNVDVTKLNHAIGIARSARFEHGKSGN